jgi:hypothetical protein
MSTPVAFTKEQIEASERETAALKDWARRVAANHPDWGLYYPGDPRPRVRWWHHLLGHPPDEPLFGWRARRHP